MESRQYVLNFRILTLSDLTNITLPGLVVDSTCTNLQWGYAYCVEGPVF